MRKIPMWESNEVPKLFEHGMWRQWRYKGWFPCAYHVHIAFNQRVHRITDKFPAGQPSRNMNFVCLPCYIRMHKNQCGCVGWEEAEDQLAVDLALLRLGAFKDG